MTTQGDVMKAKMRYKLHQLKKGKNADEWHVFLNKSLRPGEAPWAPLGSKLWKIPRYELAYAQSQSRSSSENESSEGEESEAPISTERRSSV